MDDRTRLINNVMNAHQAIMVQMELILSTAMYPLSNKPWNTQYIISLEDGVKQHHEWEERLLGQYIGHALLNLQNWHKEIEQYLHNASVLAAQEGVNFGQHSYVPDDDLRYLLSEVCDLIKEDISREYALFLQKQSGQNNSNLIYA